MVRDFAYLKLNGNIDQSTEPGFWSRSDPRAQRNICGESTEGTHLSDVRFSALRYTFILVVPILAQRDLEERGARSHQCSKRA